MSGLRWVLLGLGALLIVGIYLWGRGVWRRSRASAALPSRAMRIEPTVLDEPVMDPEDSLAPDELAFSIEETPASSASVTSPDTEEAPPHEAPETERVVTVRLVSKDGAVLNGQTAVLALRAAGLQHGRYGIFHRMPEPGASEPLFSVANLTEPGSFDLTNLAASTLPGMSFFLLLPGIGDPVERFDMMVDAARSLARELDCELHDDRGSSWSIQRERYIREQIIEYRHELRRARAGS